MVFVDVTSAAVQGALRPVSYNLRRGYQRRRPRALSGLQLPAYTVPIVRPLFQQAGLAPQSISDSGEIDANALVLLAFDRVTVKSRLFDDVVIDLKAPPNPAMEARLREVQPAVVLEGRAGRVDITPYGMPQGVAPEAKSAWTDVAWGLGLAAAGLVVLGAVLFRR